MKKLMKIKYIFLFVIILTFIYVILFLFHYQFESFQPKNQISFNFNISLNDINNYIKNGNKTAAQHQYSFSLHKSNAIGGHREIPDTRHSNCAQKSYELNQIRPNSVSVIIVYHNEARSTLLRTIISIIKRTPFKYLKEIILIDDFNDDVNQGVELKFLIPFIKLIRNPMRKGLIKSRNDGVQISSGDYIVFLDSHCEVNINWLEPLLSRLIIYSGNAVSPILDSINTKTFQYTSSTAYLKGGFDWNLNFHWIPMSEEEREQRIDSSQPFSSPSFSGGVFMVSREWFLKLNGFNPNLEIWGGESIEMAIKLWLCGGKIEIVPCSRIGHVFQNRHSFEFPNGSYTTYLRNSKIIAESWLDEYKYFFYALKPAAKNLPLQSFKDIQLMKRDLQCRPFNWYLKVVFSELKLPNEEYIAYGKILLGRQCLSVDNTNGKLSNGKVLMKDCYKNVDITNWLLNIDTGKLTTESGACLDVINNEVILQYCKDIDSQQWKRLGGNLINKKNQYCLENNFKELISINLCRPGASTQLFSFSIELQKL